MEPMNALIFTAVAPGFARTVSTRRLANLLGTHSEGQADRARRSAAGARRVRANGRSPAPAGSRGRSGSRRSASRAAGYATECGRLRDPRARVRHPTRSGDREAFRGPARWAFWTRAGTVSRDTRWTVDHEFRRLNTALAAWAQPKPDPEFVAPGSSADFGLDSGLRSTRSGRCRRSSAGRAAHS